MAVGGIGCGVGSIGIIVSYIMYPSLILWPPAHAVPHLFDECHLPSSLELVVVVLTTQLHPIFGIRTVQLGGLICCG